MTNPTQSAAGASDELPERFRRHPACTQRGVCYDEPLGEAQVPQAVDDGAGKRGHEHAVDSYGRNFSDRVPDDHPCAPAVACTGHGYVHLPKQVEGHGEPVHDCGADATEHPVRMQGRDGANEHERACARVECGPRLGPDKEPSSRRRDGAAPHHAAQALTLGVTLRAQASSTRNRLVKPYLQHIPATPGSSPVRAPSSDGRWAEGYYCWRGRWVAKHRNRRTIVRITTGPVPSTPRRLLRTPSVELSFAFGRQVRARANETSPFRRVAPHAASRT